MGIYDDYDHKNDNPGPLLAGNYQIWLEEIKIIPCKNGATALSYVFKERNTQKKVSAFAIRSLSDNSPNRSILEALGGGKLPEKSDPNAKALAEQVTNYAIRKWFTADIEQTADGKYNEIKNFGSIIAIKQTVIEQNNNVVTFEDDEIPF